MPARYIALVAAALLLMFAIPEPSRKYSRRSTPPSPIRKRARMASRSSTTSTPSSRKPTVMPAIGPPSRPRGTTRLLPLRILVGQLELQLCLGLLTRTRSRKAHSTEVGRLPPACPSRCEARFPACRARGRPAANGREFPLRDAEPVRTPPAGTAFAAAALAAAGIVGVPSTAWATRKIRTKSVTKL